jgi:hypothetical protein
VHNSLYLPSQFWCRRKQKIPKEGPLSCVSEHWKWWFGGIINFLTCRERTAKCFCLIAIPYNLIYVRGLNKKQLRKEMSRTCLGLHTVSFVTCTNCTTNIAADGLQCKLCVNKIQRILISFQWIAHQALPPSTFSLLHQHFVLFQFWINFWNTEFFYTALRTPWNVEPFIARPLFAQKT